MFAAFAKAGRGFKFEDLTTGPAAGPPFTISKCWADKILPNGETDGESCNNIVSDCRIGLCLRCCAALCGRPCK